MVASHFRVVCFFSGVEVFKVASTASCFVSEVFSSTLFMYGACDDLNFLQSLLKIWFPVCHGVFTFMILETPHGVI